MAYLEIHQSLPTHKKTIRAATRLKVARPLVMGYMLGLWSWGLDNADADGLIEDAYPEEIAAAAGVPEKKAQAFVDTLVEVHFLDRDGDKLRFHNWKRYTWRVYDLKENREAASTDGKKGNHIKWHVDRGIVSPTCEFCIAPESPPNRVPDETRVGFDIAPESQTLSPPSFLPSDLSNVLPLATNARATKGAASTSKYNLSPAEWTTVNAQFPTVNTFALWREWVIWIEESEEKRKPEDNVAAFIGFLRKKTATPTTTAAAGR